MVVDRAFLYAVNSLCVVKAQGATVTVYDPMPDRTVPVTIDRRGLYTIAISKH